MKSFVRLFLLMVITVTTVSVTAAQSAAAFVKADISQAEIDRIVSKFTQNEKLFRQALGVYAFDRSATIQTIGMGGQITGTFRRDSFLTFDGEGKRSEKILFAPISTLTEITITQADLENLGGLDPFAIEPEHIDKYKFTYLGKEKIDELDLYVFDVAPKVMPKVEKNGLRLFSGRVWIDDRDLQIVKSRGKAVPEPKGERFAAIETIRENVDGRYWFPSYSSSDDELVFDNGSVVKMRIRVKYSNYRVGRSDVKIVDEEDVVEPKPAATPRKP